MFSLTVIDLVRLDSTQAARNYTLHARAAERIASLAFKCRIGVMAVLTLAASAAILNLLSPWRPYQIAAVVTSTLALLAFSLYEMLGLDVRLSAHRSFAHRLWLVSERYRSLLSEVAEGAVDGHALVQRRDELMHELHAAYETGLGMNQAGFEVDRLAVIDERAA